MLARILAVIGLQGFAILTAMLHQHLGLHTDEAKYLLNIPYPHPPLMRWLMGLTDGWQHQELFWRIVFASCLVHGVWLVADMARQRSRKEQLTLSGLWLFSGALLLQSGTLLMATITAVEALFLCWLLTRPELLQRWSILIAALWLEMLFVAYQGILFAPLVWMALRRSDLSLWKQIAALIFPVILLIFYTLSNPLAVAALGLIGGMGRGVPPDVFVSRSLKLWLIGGSGVLSVLGFVGAIRTRHWALLLTLMLLSTYSAVSYREYYAILFAPVFIAGAVQFRRVASPAFSLSLQVVIGVLLFLYIPFASLSNARSIGEALNRAGIAGPVLIKGSFGHEWQYLMPGPVTPYREKFMPEAKIVVCLEECGDLPKEWRKLNAEEEVWVR